MKIKTKVIACQCLICSQPSNLLFTHKIVNGHVVSYFQCSRCHFIQTEKPYWLDEAYASPINVEDTGILQRNIALVLRTVPFLLTLKKNIQILDFAGGYGIFTRLLRDLGFDAYWVDSFCQNLIARGFESSSKQKFEVVTAFEVFEHLVDPISEVKKMLHKGDTIIFSTQLSDNVSSEALIDWWYMGFSHGQHVSIYSLASLQLLAAHLHLQLFSDKQYLHVLSKEPLSWLQKLALTKFAIISFPLVFLLRKSKTMSDHIANKR